MFWDRARTIGQWVFFGTAVGAACGLASAAFLTLLELATAFRTSHEAVIYALPVAGLVLGLIYEQWGKPIEGGNNLIIDALHEDRPQVPLRMAPMVLIGTVLTHLFGGSAGREGTAVQMGGSLADELAHRFQVGRDLRRQLLAAGIAGGFGSVFGTPIAGAIFGLEVAYLGRIEYGALVPALIASVVGDLVTRGLGVAHTAYPTLGFVSLSPLLVGKWILFGLAMGLASLAFVELVHFCKRQLGRALPRLPWRMMLGGAVVVGLWKLMGTSDYLGLGVPVIVRSFTAVDLAWYAFAIKLVLTAITLGAGFLGGEVTPLFFVGATLGSVLARLLGVPIELGAGIGLAAVFGAAANTPVALSIMAVELLGAAVFPHVVIVAVIAYLVSGHRGIYASQRIVHGKSGGAVLDGQLPLGEYASRARDAPTDEPPPGR